MKLVTFSKGGWDFGSGFSWKLTWSIFWTSIVDSKWTKPSGFEIFLKRHLLESGGYLSVLSSFSAAIPTFC